MERVDYESLIIQDLINLWRREELDIAPWYQRRSVWAKPQKAYLINSVFEAMPIPTIYIRHYIDIEKELSIKEIVDGQQRVRAILEYGDNEFAARHPDHPKPIQFQDLSRKQRSAYLMTKLSVGYLINADDSDVIEIFGRLNSVSKTLNEQEKRNARFSGEYKHFCLSEAATRVNLWRTLGIFTANDIARMQEVQFISDLVLNLIEGLSDYSSSKLNSIYKENDEVFPQRGEMSDELERIFARIASFDPSTIKDTIFSRQPIFFSLCLILPDLPKKTKPSNIERALWRIDEVFNADIPISEHTKGDAEFIVACTASTQRISSRRIRDKYIRKKIGTA